MPWAGARSGSPEVQAYYTSKRLAQEVARVVRRYAGPYAELGVGSGMLYNELPEGRQGVEVRRLTPALPGVRYGMDALRWRPKGKVGVVVMNPPFSRQIEFFNHASTFTDIIVWIAGLNIRLWTNEAELDSMMHLEREWLVPPEWSSFKTESGDVQIRTVVQVWRRKRTPRDLWRLCTVSYTHLTLPTNREV